MYFNQEGLSDEGIKAIQSFIRSQEIFFAHKKTLLKNSNIPNKFSKKKHLKSLDINRCKLMFNCYGSDELFLSIRELVGYMVRENKRGQVYALIALKSKNNKLSAKYDHLDSIFPLQGEHVESTLLDFVDINPTFNYYYNPPKELETVLVSG